MIFIPVRGILGVHHDLKIDLAKSFKGYQVGLVSFNFPNTNRNPFVENSIDLTCDQIDCTLFNPTRLVKRLCFNKVDRNDYFNQWQANHIEFYPIDSNDSFLTIKMARTISSSTNGSDITYSPPPV